MRAREKNDISRWFKFFLIGIIETAQKGILTFDQILQLQKSSEAKIASLGSRASKAQKVLNYLYQKPIVNATDVGTITGLSAASAYKLANNMEKLGIFREVTGGQRGKLYVFDDYLKLFR